MSSSPKTFTVKLSKMLRNKGVVYLSFHLSKSDVKAHRLVHIVVHCENMYNVQLSSQILFSQLHVRSFKSFGAAVEWFIIVGRIQ